MDEYSRDIIRRDPLRRNIEWNNILERPDVVRQRTFMGYPLHEACRMGLSLPFIRSLVELFPEAITDSRVTPLFKACSYERPDMDTISFLVKLDPSCLRGTADRPPLLHFCMRITDQDVDVNRDLVDWVTSQYPEAADLPDFQGRYLIHHSPASNDVQRFRKLLVQTPTSCLADAHGNHLLHLAVERWRCHPQNLACILELCPTAVTFRNHRGQLPAHVATRNEVQILLLERHPFAIFQMTHDGATILSEARRSESFRLYFPAVGEFIDGGGDSTGDARSIPRRRRDEEDWEMPYVCVRYAFNSPRSILRHLDELFNILSREIHKLLPPLRRVLNRSCHLGTGNCLPPEILNEILLFAIPHYEEALTYTPYFLD